ncbi:hypothetical protein Ahy_A07g035793 [Arachis hypogaea]|uniref:W2 domain-containing protein n=1 Tax=Arachis hypogaea TaxID=3818 RepID=A0A445CEP4_ARAHY|nr:hypothetical protein Ahy_A07g035793 [Arachis hypogaea]
MGELPKPPPSKQPPWLPIVSGAVRTLKPPSSPQLVSPRSSIAQPLSRHAASVPPRQPHRRAPYPALCSILKDLGSENGDIVNYATVVREVKAYLKKDVAAKELQSHIAAFPVSAQEKMNALLEGLFDGVEKVFGKEATKRKNHLAGAVAGDDEGSQLLLLNAAEEFCYKKGSNELNEVALILKALYDVDLVEEEHVVHWYSKGLKGDIVIRRTLRYGRMLNHSLIGFGMLNQNRRKNEKNTFGAL